MNFVIEYKVNLQQTPNPAAQFPSAVPDFDVHSELVKHVPMVVDELVDVHSSLGNCTTEKRDNSSKIFGCFNV